MPVPGPKDIKPVRRGKNPRFEYREIEDTPNTNYPKLKRHAGFEYHPFTIKWWSVICQMPIAKEWRAEDWQFAQETALIFNRWVDSLSPVLMRELRHRETAMGMTMDARRGLRIRYVDKDVPEPGITDPEIDAEVDALMASI